MKSIDLIFTIGHSTRPIQEFIKILKTYDVDLLVDIRHYPGSRNFPQFGKTRLRNSLAKSNIDYVHLESLGGRRRMNKESEINSAWRSSQFRGYADHMQSREFKQGLKELMALAKKHHVAIMCSEAVPWRCHRQLVADALMAHDFVVFDLIAENSVKPHDLTPFAQVEGREVFYPATSYNPAIPQAGSRSE